MTDFFPGFDAEDEKGFDSIESLIPNDGGSVIRIRAEKRRSAKGYGVFGPHHFGTFAFRARQFLFSLPAARRAEIARRPRFRNQPYLRRADSPDADDLP